MSSNILKEYTDFSIKNINNYAKKSLGKYYDKEIFEYLSSIYQNIRYYDLYSSMYSSLETNINYYLKDSSDKILEKDSTKKDLVKVNLHFFKFVYYLDDIRTCDDYNILVDAIDNYRINVLNLKEEENFKTEMLSLIAQNNKRKKEYLESFNCNDFYLEKTKTNIKNVFNINLLHNIKFPALYSTYAIDKAYTTGIVNEQRLFVEYHLLSLEILNKAINGNFKMDYIAEFDINIVDKKLKTNRLFNLIDNDICKEKINLKINYKDFIENRDLIYEFIHEGYKFALIIDDTYQEEKIEKQVFDLFNYIIVENTKIEIENTDKLIICK